MATGRRRAATEPHAPVSPRSSNRARPVRSSARSALLAFAVALAPLAACDQPAAAGERSVLDRAAGDAWRGSRLHDFELFERDGRKLTLADLAGKTLVVDFVFTQCAGPCPALSAGMFSLQEELADTDVLLVTVSVDPVNDTGEVLDAYAKELGADAQRWLFLRGSEEQLQALMASVNLAVEASPDAAPGFQITHSTRLVVVDGEGWVRGYYAGTEADGLERAAARARWLDGR